MYWVHVVDRRTMRQTVVHTFFCLFIDSHINLKKRASTTAFCIFSPISVMNILQVTVWTCTMCYTGLKILLFSQVSTILVCIHFMMIMIVIMQLHNCVYACITITFICEDKSRHSPLFMLAMWLYVPDQAYLHFTAIQITYSPPSLQHSLWPASLSHQQGYTAFPAIFGFLSCMAHCWTTAGTEHITAACRETQTKTGEWAKGSRGPWLVWDIPLNSGPNSKLFATVLNTNVE